MTPSNLIKFRKFVISISSRIYRLYNDNAAEKLAESLGLYDAMTLLLDLFAQHYVKMNWDEYYNGMDTRKAYDTFGCFPPDKIYNLIYDNKKLDIKQIETYFKMTLKGNKNDKTRKTSSKRAK
jgi:hypothetical protein